MPPLYPYIANQDRDLLAQCARLTAENAEQMERERASADASPRERERRAFWWERDE